VKKETTGYKVISELKVANKFMEVIMKWEIKTPKYFYDDRHLRIKYKILTI
jgi:hypothetical protein